MARNTLGDLNDHLFLALERVNDETLSQADLEKEMARAKVIANVGAQIIANGSLVLRAKIAQEEYGKEPTDMPKMLNG